MSASKDITGLYVVVILGAILFQGTVFNVIPEVSSFLVISTLLILPFVIINKEVTWENEQVLILGILALLLSVIVISSIVNLDSASVLLSVKILVFTILIVLMRFSIKNVEKITLNVIFLIGTLSATYGILILLFGSISFSGTSRIMSLGPFYQFADGTPPFYRISGFFNNPNGGAVISLYAFIFAVFKKNKNRYMYLALAINLLFILLTGSRTCLILAMLTILFFLSKEKKSNFSGIALAFILLTVISGVYLLVDINFNDYINSRVNDGLSSRELAWAYLLDWFYESPTFGIGVGNADIRLINDINLGFGSHSGHLALLSESGLIAYVLFLLIVVIVTYSLWKSGGDMALIIILISLMAHQVVERGVFQITIHHYIFLICIFSTTKRELR